MSKRSIALAALVLVALCAFAPAAAAAVAVTPAAVGAPEGLRIEGERAWRYRAGDDPAWAAPGLDDSAWEELGDALLSAKTFPASGWTGVCWLRARVDVDSSLAGAPLALLVWHRGASEVFVDGVRVAAFGRAGAARDEVPHNPVNRPVAVTFATPGEHVVAVRYSNAEVSDAGSFLGRWMFATGRALGVAVVLRPLDDAVAETRRRTALDAAREFGQAGVVFAFGLIHFVLFAFYRRERANLYFSGLTLAAAANVLVNYALEHAGLDVIWTYALALAILLTVAIILTSMLCHLAASFWPAALRLARWIFTVWIVDVAIFAVPELTKVSRVVYWPLIAITCAASLVVLGRALAERRDGAWIVAVGVVAILGIFVRDVVGVFLVEIPGDTNFLVGLVCLTGFLLAQSVFLARRFARTSVELEARLAEVETLSAEALVHEQERARLSLVEAENERRARELEEARDVQLSMLPASVPSVPHLDIATFMSTASEVGGDYYDFRSAPDGSLLVAVGDATGHGLKAGTVVTATKSLFCSTADSGDLRATFREFTLTLKAMRLGRLYMALTLARVDGLRVTISAAGMPPALVFRAATGEVEEILLKGMPLGAFADFRYEQRELELGDGDALLLMSDGLPELFDPEREMFDYPRTVDAFRAAGSGTATEIVAALRASGDAWARGRPQDDDVTLVVLKARTPEA